MHRLLPNRITVESGGPVHGEDSLLDIANQEAGTSIVDKLRQGPSSGGHYRRPAGHGFHNAKAERLVEVDEVKQSVSPSEEGVAVLTAHRPDVADVFVIEVWSDTASKYAWSWMMPAMTSGSPAGRPRQWPRQPPCPDGCGQRKASNFLGKFAR